LTDQTVGEFPRFSPFLAVTDTAWLFRFCGSSGETACLKWNHQRKAAFDVDGLRHFKGE
jgi:hypothetical protein